MHTLSKAVLHALGWVVQKIGLAMMAVLSSCGRQQFYKPGSCVDFEYRSTMSEMCFSAVVKQVALTQKGDLWSKLRLESRYKNVKQRQAFTRETPSIYVADERQIWLNMPVDFDLIPRTLLPRPFIRLMAKDKSCTSIVMANG